MVVKPWRKKMQDNEEWRVYLIKLATIKLDVPLDESYDDFKPNPQDTDELIKLFGKLEFKRWLAALLAGDNLVAKASASQEGQTLAPSALAKSMVNRESYKTIYTKGQLLQWIKKLEKAELFAFDTETTSLDYMQAKIVGLCFAIQTNVGEEAEPVIEAAYLPLAHDYIDAPAQLDLNETLELLTPLLTSDEHKKVGQNLKYDRSVLLNHGIELGGIAFDTMLESYVLDSTGKHNMDALALKYLGHTCISFEDIAGKGKKQLTFNEIAIKEAAPYAAEDADITLRLHLRVTTSITRNTRATNCFRRNRNAIVNRTF